ncbi:hypothetical protein MAMT_01685 [Methylacidimicrobium tartarophylax]|uniref:Uncharacterized protein n=2 Tax=Methylacidimicrobium tartarophylax TaxID=1041768 RepID=A0A5E6MCR5_9BACT|nr:hypothetical protein MAMT_01685 [Methylacidimicrobium tartarophylax]
MHSADSIPAALREDPEWERGVERLPGRFRRDGGDQKQALEIRLPVEAEDRKRLRWQQPTPRVRERCNASESLGEPDPYSRGPRAFAMQDQADWAGEKFPC